jgi:predicted AlkP superfamily pyrophosphatase or phosphodiesterase
MSVMPRLTAIAVALMLGGCAANQQRVALAEPAAPPPSGPPQLVLAISVDQLSADLYGQYRQHFTGGLKRLTSGVVFPSGYQSHAATETCPGHSTILTGVRPARNGIIANNWFEPGITRADKRVYCSEDTSDPASTSSNPVVSAQFLKVPTLGELMKRANPATRNVAVSAKDRAVVMMGGHKIDAGYWWKGSGFTSFKGTALSPAVEAQNVEVAALLKSGAPAFAVPAWCAQRDRPTQVGKTTIGTFKFALEPNKPDMFRASPRMDAATVDLANRLIDELQLGMGTVPDVLSVSLSATDYVGHAVGTEGVEMCIQMAELDKALGRLFAKLDAAGIDYIAVLTADHGGLDTSERLDERAFPRAARADAGLLAGNLGKAIAAKTGITIEGPLIYSDGPFGDYYLSAALSPAQKAQATAALVGMAKAHPQIAAVFTHEELTRTPIPTGGPQEWTLKDRARASFDPKRSGDVVILLDRAISPIPAPIPGFTATHGSAWDYDRRVPMLFWRRGVPGFEQPAPVETVDIAPTLAAIIGLRVDDGSFDGRCLDLDGGTGNSCDTLK